MKSKVTTGQDLEQQVNGEIKRIAAVQPTASIASVGNGLELLGKKIGDIGSALNQRKKQMAFDRFQTDLQISINNALSDKENIYAMQNGDFAKVKDKITEIGSQMMEKMSDPNEYDIQDEYRQFKLTEIKDTIFSNAYNSLDVKEFEYLDNKQKQEYTDMMNNKKNLLIANMNSGDETTAYANYKSALNSLEEAAKTNLITPDQKQRYLREFRTIRVTGVAERLAEEAYNRRDVKALQKYALDFDRSEWLHKNGGNGDERLGGIVRGYLSQFKISKFASDLPNNIRDASEVATREAQQTSDEDLIKVANSKNKAFEMFKADPWNASNMASGNNLEEAGDMANYVLLGNRNVLRNYVGEEEYNKMYKNSSDDEITKQLQKIKIDNDGNTLWDTINYSSDNTFGIDKALVTSYNPMTDLTNFVNNNFDGLSPETKNKLVLDFAKGLGMEELDAFNQSNANATNDYGAMLLEAKGFMQKNMRDTSGQLTSNYEVMLKQRKQEDKKFKETNWLNYGTFFGVPKKYKETMQYFMTLSDKDPMKMAALQLTKRCNGLYVLHNDDKMTQKVFQQGMDSILGNNEIVEVNGMILPMNKLYTSELTTINKEAYNMLAGKEILADGVVRKDLEKTTNLRSNLYYVPYGNDQVMLKHKAFGEILDVNTGKPIIMNINKIYKGIQSKKQQEKISSAYYLKGKTKTTGTY